MKSLNLLLEWCLFVKGQNTNYLYKLRQQCFAYVVKFNVWCACQVKYDKIDLIRDWLQKPNIYFSLQVAEDKWSENRQGQYVFWAGICNLKSLNKLWTHMRLQMLESGAETNLLKKSTEAGDIWEAEG